MSDAIYKTMSWLSGIIGGNTVCQFMRWNTAVNFFFQSRLTQMYSISTNQIFSLFIVKKKKNKKLPDFQSWGNIMSHGTRQVRQRWKMLTLARQFKCRLIWAFFFSFTFRDHSGCDAIIHNSASICNSSQASAMRSTSFLFQVASALTAQLSYGKGITILFK